MTAALAPSILSCDPADLATAVRRMMAAGADRIHLDVMDGQFVPPITFGAALAASLHNLGPTPIEAHLMTLSPERHASDFVEAGCETVILHVEATHHVHRALTEVRKAGARVGVAINPGTPVQAVVPVLDVVDMVLVMTVNPGWGGQSLIESCVDKVRELRRMRPGLEIEVDGGVDVASAGPLCRAGASVLVAGSFLMTDGAIEQNMERLREACNSA